MTLAVGVPAGKQVAESEDRRAIKEAVARADLIRITPGQKGARTHKTLEADK